MIKLIGKLPIYANKNRQNTVVNRVNKMIKAKGIIANINEWHNIIDSNHSELREILGGISNKFKVTIKIKQEELGEKDLNLYYNSIQEIIPDFWTRYNVTKDILKFPTCVHKKRTMKTGHFILTYATKFAKVSGTHLHKLNMILMNLGQKWAKLRDFNKEYYAIISTHPASYIMLGHYGPDNRSCFKNGGQNWTHKYNLAAVENSFVLLIKEKTNNKMMTISRQWGFYNAKEMTFNTCNAYFIHIQDTVLKEINTKIFSHLLKGDAFLHEGILRIVNSQVWLYHNDGLGSVHRYDWTFSKDQNTPLHLQCLERKTPAFR